MHPFTNSVTCILIREQQKEVWKVGFVYLSVLQHWHLSKGVAAGWLSSRQAREQPARVAEAIASWREAAYSVPHHWFGSSQGILKLELVFTGNIRQFWSPTRTIILECPVIVNGESLSFSSCYCVLIFFVVNILYENSVKLGEKLARQGSGHYVDEAWSCAGGAHRDPGEFGRTINEFVVRPSGQLRPYSRT